MTPDRESVWIILEATTEQSQNMSFSKQAMNGQTQKVMGFFSKPWIDRDK